MTATPKLLFWGSTPVPYTVSWSAETPVYLGHCPHTNRPAICQPEARGEGKPEFGNPHMQRQREAIANKLCDLCGKPLAARTRVSLSHARPQVHAVEPLDVLQVEPLLHRRCARDCLRWCPALKRDIVNGTLAVRQVYRHRAQFAVYSAEGTFQATGTRAVAICYAKVQLIEWRDRDARWLERTP